MTEPKTSPKVDSVLRQAGTWRDEFTALRRIALNCPLTEDLKWGQPCYAHEGRNIVLIHGFKDYCALLFMKGALMKDPAGILVQQTENVQSARQIRFKSLSDILGREAVLTAYILDAIAVTQAGLKAPMKTTAEFSVPEEFQTQLDENPDLKAAFEALTPGRQRGYLLHFSGAKQSKTRAARIEKALPLIFAGKGLMEE